MTYKVDLDALAEKYKLQTYYSEKLPENSCEYIKSEYKEKGSLKTTKPHILRGTITDTYKYRFSLAKAIVSHIAPWNIAERGAELLIPEKRYWTFLQAGNKEDDLYSTFGLPKHIAKQVSISYKNYAKNELALLDFKRKFISNGNSNEI